MDSSDVELPTLPHIIADQSRSRPSPVYLAGRKRPFLPTPKVDEDDLAAAFNTSSDPAVFSSEDTPDLDNYSGSKRRKKKIYSGTWWSRLRPRHKSHTSQENGGENKRQFRRNFDSGIFMGDESSSGPDLSSDPADDFQLPAPLSKESSSMSYGGLVDVHLAQHKTEISKPIFRRAPSRILVEKSATDVQVERVVQKCLDNGTEDVDLTNLCLDSLPSTITDLNTLVRHNSGLAFSALSSRLRLYLGNNSLLQFPLPVLELRRITLLSLRQNRLRQIPPGIRKLRKLAELNISGNEIQFLPFELIELLDNGNLVYFAHDPNPWISAIPPNDRLQNAPFVEINSNFHILNRMAVQPATEIGPIGNLIISNKAVKFRNTSRSPHLTELILRKLHREGESAKAISTLYSDILSDNVLSLLDQLHESQAGHSKGLQCTFCKQDIVLPRYRWFEWWRVTVRPENNIHRIKPEGIPRYRVLENAPESNPDDPILPFLRVACGCVTQDQGLQQEATGFLKSVNPVVKIAEQETVKADNIL